MGANHISDQSANLLVAGGGLSGVMAAIAVKRTNPELNVWIVEKYGFLGGMATAGYVFPFMKYHTRDSKTGKIKRLSGGLFKEMLDLAHEKGFTEKRARTKDFYSRFDPIMLRCVLDDMVLKENINVLFHAIINKVNVDESEANGKRITSISAQTKAGEINFSFQNIIDATGDADIIYHAGGKTQMGREEDGLVQPGTLNFRMGNLGLLAPQRRYITKKVLEEKSKGNPLTPRDDCLMFMGQNNRERHFNQTRVAQFDFTDPFDMSKAEIEGRQQAERFILFLRNKIRGYNKATVCSMGSQIGIRETRRIEGEYQLTAEDLTSCKQFKDRIALGNYSIDIHDPKGTASTDIRRIPKGKWYSIPYRSLIPKDFANALVAGRPISSTHVAHSAIRIMPICSIIGHAAGVAAGLKSKLNEDVAFRDINVTKLQEELRNQGAILE